MDDEIRQQVREIRVAYFGIKSLPSQGGAERVVEAIVRRMPDYGVKPIVYCDAEYTPLDTSIAGVDLVRVPAISGKHLRSTSLTLAAAWHAILKGQYDLIHLHNLEASFILPLLRMKYRVISTSHGFAYLRDKWSPLAKRMIKTMEWPFVYLSNIATSVSSKDAQLLSQKYDRDILYIPNGVGTEYPPEWIESKRILESHGLIPGEYLIFVAGRIIPTKGAHFLIEALNSMRNPQPLLIVGDASHSDDYVKMLRGNANSLVRFHDLIDDPSTLFGLMASARALVFPSLVEAMSMVLLEAASLGVPILCSDIPENSKVMGDTVLYFESGNVTSLKESIDWMIENPESLKGIGRRAQDLVLKNYSWDTIAGHYARIYQHLVQLPLQIPSGNTQIIAKGSDKV